MNKKCLSSFLTSMFEDRKLFTEVNGTKNIMDAKYMLVADALSENIDLLSEVILEQINLNINSKNSINRNKNRASAAF